MSRIEPELDAPVAELHAAYVAELGPVVDSLRAWWQGLEATLERTTLRLRWPAGLGSHPRVLAIYRDYHRRFTELESRPPAGPALRFDDEAAWGGAPSPRIPVPVERLLVDRLQLEAPALHAVMCSLVMPPIGEPPEPRPSFRALDMIAPAPRRPRRFGFALRHGVERGRERLLGAGRDLRSNPAREVARANASEFHRLAHAAYARALELALADAESWWRAALLEREARGLSADEALDDLYQARPCGPVTHPRVLGVIQAYWVVCEEINAVVSLAERVGSEQVLLGWLDPLEHETWIAALTAMPYWPVGIDGAGRWV